MIQLLIIILGAALGLLYGYDGNGFVFSSKVCLFAGLTLIMPTLFNVKFQDIKLLFHYKTLIIKGLFINYLILPALAVGIGLLTGSFGVAAGLFLLSVLSGGGMVMHWIKKSNSDTSMGFILLFVNLMFVSLSLLMLHIFGMYTASYFGESYRGAVNVKSVAFAAMVLLIIIPFVSSRIIILIKPLRKLIEEKRSYISQVSLFLILFYLFGLQRSQYIFEIYDFEPELFYLSLVAVIIFYTTSFFLSKWLYNLNSPQERAAFWHTVTRYITLALVLSTLTTNTFGVSIILPIMFAYVVQIPFAIYADKKMGVWSKE